MIMSPPPRIQRLDRIRHLITSGTPIPNQETLRVSLAQLGYDVNQATLSRDLRALGVVKGPDGYTMPEAPVVPRLEHSQQALSHALAEWLLEAKTAQNQLVLATPPGGAQALARAIDLAPDSSVVGTLAGDDTILVICPDARAAKQLARDWTGLATAGRSA